MSSRWAFSRIGMDNHETKIVIAGFGGQGVVLAGTLIAKACIYEGLNVTAMVSYGAEMRGGTANSTVVISGEQIASPVVEKPDIAIILNQPSLDKFEEKLVDGGLIILNSTLAKREVQRQGLDVVRVEATKAAQQLGNIRVANVVALGAFVKKTKLLKKESLSKAIEEQFSQKKAGLVDINYKALQTGAQLVNTA
jgi:2-oxoglutarate ferredoxin oxidoreductase subunit gamma